MSRSQANTAIECPHCHRGFGLTATILPEQCDGRVSFSIEKARAVRLLYRSGAFTQADLARKFNFSQASISKVVRNEAWVEKPRIVLSPRRVASQ